jgi:glutamate carboxypeptidase
MADREAILERLAGYVGHESPTGSTDALNVFVTELAQVYRALGANVRREPTPGGDHLVADLPGRGALSIAAPIVLLGHSDTVWDLETLAAMPWSVDDGVARGPGVYDMKAGLIIIETALAMLVDGDRDHPPVRVLIACDEEIGSPTFRALLEQAVEGADCALGFEPPHPGGALKTARRGSCRVRLEVTGKPAHAALDPDKGISAIEELLDQLLVLRRLVATATAAVPQSVLLNVGTISGGTRTNVVAGAAQADLGLRFADDATENRILATLDALTPIRPGAVVSSTVLSHRPTWMHRSTSDALLERMNRAGERVGQPVDGRPAAGAADTNTTGWLGIPTLDGLGPDGGGAHAGDERMIVESLYERIALLHAFLTDTVPTDRNP